MSAPEEEAEREAAEEEGEEEAPEERGRFWEERTGSKSW